MEQNTEGLRLIACPHPFAAERIAVDRPAGGTVADLMRSINMDPGRTFARVFIDDRLIPEAQWEHATPAAGQLVTVRTIPTGGDGGGGKDVLRVVAMIAIVAVSAWVSGGAGGLLADALGASFAGGTVGAAVAGATVGIGLSLAMNAHIPAPLPRRSVPQPIPARALEEAA